MKDNIKAGADIHAGDGGYSLGTQEKYDEFVKGRNQSLGKARIREIAEHCDFYVGNEHYDKTREEQQRLFMEKFAELIVRECMRMCDVAAIGYESHGHMKEANGCYSAKEYIEEHFGVEE